MTASVLSNKIAAGSTHLILDMPVGPTAKVRSRGAADALSAGLVAVADAFGIKARVVAGDGTEPIGRGIGPALEANDVLAVLQCLPAAPRDLRNRAVTLAGALIELGGLAEHGRVAAIPDRTLDDGRAWAKFQGSARRRAACARRRARAIAGHSLRNEPDGWIWWTTARSPSSRNWRVRPKRRRRASNSREAGRNRLGRAASVHGPCRSARRTCVRHGLCRCEPRHHHGPRAMTPILLIPMPGNERLAAGLAAQLDCETGELNTRRFPDGETYLRFATDLDKRSVAIVCTLAPSNEKILPLIFAAATARELGAWKVGLVAPYLAYMRQDRRFNPGEAVTSRQMAHLISETFDWMATVDPHLHRYGDLSEIYSIPTRVVHAAPLVSR